MKWGRKAEELFEGGCDFIVGHGIGMRANGEPSLLTRAVAQKCVEVWKEKGGKIIFTGGAKEAGVSEAEAMRKIALEAGVPAEAILAEISSLNTYENVRNSLKIIIEVDPLARDFFRKIVVVGWKFHLGRCLALWKNALTYYLLGYKRSQGLFWDIRGLKAYSGWDPLATQKRLHGLWRFLVWNLMAWVYFKLRGWI